MFGAGYWGEAYFGAEYWPPVGETRRPGGGVGDTGGSRRWIRKRFDIDEIEEAIEALQRAEQSPTKRKIKTAKTKIAAITRDVPDPYYDNRLEEAVEAIEDNDPLEALLQLRFILEAVAEFKARDRREQDALISILLAT